MSYSISGWLTSPIDTSILVLPVLTSTPTRLCHYWLSDMSGCSLLVLESSGVSSPKLIVTRSSRVWRVTRSVCVWDPLQSSKFKFVLIVGLSVEGGGKGFAQTPETPHIINRSIKNPHTNPHKTVKRVNPIHVTLGRLKIHKFHWLMKTLSMMWWCDWLIR
jgi:hypothetical protein